MKCILQRKTLSPTYTYSRELIFKSFEELKIIFSRNHRTPSNHGLFFGADQSQKNKWLLRKNLKGIQHSSQLRKFKLIILPLIKISSYSSKSKIKKISDNKCQSWHKKKGILFTFNGTANWGIQRTKKSILGIQSIHC